MTLNDFYLQRDKEKDRRKLAHRRAYDQANKEKIRERKKNNADSARESRRRWKEKNPDYRPPNAEFSFLRYGITPYQMEKMVFAQGGVCKNM